MSGKEKSLAKTAIKGLLIPAAVQTVLTILLVTLILSTDRLALQSGIRHETTSAITRFCTRSSAVLARVDQALLSGQPPDPQTFEDQEGLKVYIEKLNSRKDVPEDIKLRAVSTADLSNRLLVKIQKREDPGTLRTDLATSIASLLEWNAKHPIPTNPRDEQVRQNILLCVIAATIINVLALLALGTFFLRTIVERLRLLLENTIRLASGSPILPPIAGNDEIAGLDRDFRNMADCLEATERQQRSLIDNAHDVICSLDAKLNFISASPSARSVFGRDSEELAGTALANIIAGGDRANLRERFDRANESELELIVLRPDGTSLETVWTTRWSPADDMFICTAHDNTERKASERMRQHILEMVSHDLRAPLTSIQGFHGLLQTGKMGELNDRGSTLLTMATKNCDRMLSLVNDLLDTEMLRSGNLQINPAPLSVREAVTLAADAVQFQATNKHITIKAIAPDASVFADASRLSQILNNLLTNAIKFSPERSVIEVGAEQQSADVIEFYVRDQGRGIPGEMVEAIFDRFRQTDQSDARRGTGLGLWICKALVELHGGAIRCESEPGRGSTFRFSMPVNQVIRVYQNKLA